MSISEAYLNMVADRLGFFEEGDHQAVAATELLLARKKIEAAEKMATAIEMIAETTECSFDHHGNCQEHGGWEEGIPCSDRFAIESLIAYRSLK